MEQLVSSENQTARIHTIKHICTITRVHSRVNSSNEGGVLRMFDILIGSRFEAMKQNEIFERWIV